jgi:hypothetical protein
VAELSLIAKHQFAGWGWQQDDAVTPAADDGHYYSEETALAQAATRLASYTQFTTPPSHKTAQTQAIFVYRHSQMALSWYTVQRAASANKANDDMWMKGSDGRICIDRNRGGPAWNFSNPRAADFFVDEVVGELTREADINAVFFDETDYEYCGGDTCHGQFLTPDYYRAKIEVLRRTAAKLNSANIWPMFSSMNENVAQSRCSLPYSDYYDALRDVGWIRFCTSLASHSKSIPYTASPLVRLSWDGLMLALTHLGLTPSLLFTCDRRVLRGVQPREFPTRGVCWIARSRACSRQHGKQSWTCDVLAWAIELHILRNERRLDGWWLGLACGV